MYDGGEVGKAEVKRRQRGEKGLVTNSCGVAHEGNLLACRAGN